jgi:antitoxin (DNA-binding transcriptional repressor) of toxin-antitoxin stability system
MDWTFFEELHILHMHMETVTYGVRELQARLGEVLRAVESGKRVYVASRKKIVAMITQPDMDLPDESSVERKLRRLAAGGKVRLGRQGRIRPYSVPRVEGLARQVLEDRR